MRKRDNHHKRFLDGYTVSTTLRYIGNCTQLTAEQVEGYLKGTRQVSKNGKWARILKQTD